MSRKCEICGKGPMIGNTIARRGLAKRKNGAGRKITGVTRVWRYPNLQDVKVVINKTPKKISVCAKCLKKGDLEKRAACA